jgi:isopentenyl-diphosphate delta-isomerase
MIPSPPSVSFADEPLILVDPSDQIIGYRDKASCHVGEGLLHRAFSIYLFDAAGNLLMQQRAPQKTLWPNYWSNTCCSHPRRGETVEQAAHRRLEDELGLHAELRYLYKFIYQARFADVGSEHELCSVFVGRATRPPRVHPEEISATRFFQAAEIDRLVADPHSDFTPWLRLQWPQLRAHHGPLIRGLCQAGAL